MIEFVTIQQYGNRFRWEIYRDTHLVGWGEWRDSEGEVELELQVMKLSANIRRYEALA